MFTGQIKANAIIVDMHMLDGGIKLCVVSNDCLNLKPGDSINCSGVCLTVVYSEVFYFELEVWGNTLCSSNLVSVHKFDTINIEKPINLHTSLHGHIINGHVKCATYPLKAIRYGKSLSLTVSCPKWICDSLKAPCSISLNGVSLTIIRMGDRWFEVLLIRYSLVKTTFRYFNSKSILNLE